jgi:hypothetical protein
MLKNNKHTLQLKASHFAALIVAFFLCTTLLSAIQLRRMPESEPRSDFPAFEGQMPETGLQVVFFHDNSQLCNKMRYNLEQSAAPDMHYFTADVAAHPHYIDEYRLSGTPIILIFKEEKEILRIMGVVSQSNLKKIYEKIR